MTDSPVAQIALISESKRLQLMLNTYGISTQTPLEVEPVSIWPSRRLVEVRAQSVNIHYAQVFECLGRNDRLGLSGRPSRPFGELSTSKVRFTRFGKL
jgi:phosphorylase kinase alpha/beta subunit